MTVTPVRVGLVGAGPWAARMHAPTFAAGPETELAAVWARRPDAAAALAQRHGAQAARSFTELLDLCEAVAFAAPPDVQAKMAPQAAAAGRPILLEKPLALDLTAAKRLAEAIATADVPSMMVLTKRFHPRTQQFLAASAELAASGSPPVHLPRTRCAPSLFRSSTVNFTVPPRLRVSVSDPAIDLSESRQVQWGLDR